MERRTSSLDALVATLQQRYGMRAARRGDALPEPMAPAVAPTGLAEFDTALPHGGLPQGALTELIGPRSAGATTLALRVIAQAQAAGDLACLLDLSRSFAPAAAAGAGVDLDGLAVVHPTDGAEAALAVATLLSRRAVSTLVVDSLPAWLALPGGAQALVALRARLPRLLVESGCVLIVLHPLPTGLLPDPAVASHDALAHLVSLRLHLVHQGWLRRGPSIVGCRTKVAVLTPPFATPTATLTIELPFARGEDQA
jgi:recombination protein RecA